MSTTRRQGSAGRQRPIATIYDIAQATGLNASTVSRALRGTGRVSRTTSERVTEAARDLGYRANALARGLTSGRTHTLAFIVADITNPMIFDVVRGAEREALEHGFTLVVAESHESGDEESTALERLIPIIDGAILAVSRLDDQALREVAAKVPVTLINRVADTIPSVVPDVASGSAELVEHLAALGHRHLVYVAGPEQAWVGGRRWQAVCERAGELGLAITQVGPLPPTREGGASSVPAVLATGATAAIAFNDLMAIGLLGGLRAAGVDVPGHLSVAGFDNIFGSDFTTPTLTTVRAPLAELGASAVQLLLGIVRGDEPRSATSPAPPTSLVVRDSTGPAGVRPAQSGRSRAAGGPAAGR